jgi:benzoyl-CoA reductase/2-hydroxyglutaryl-CoA dehydratase subunit BcrC/BadD/HgdB
MNYFETQIARLSRIIKKINENPDTSRLSSNKVYYELELDLVKTQWEAWRKGKPFAYVSPHSGHGIARALGFQWLFPNSSANRAWKQGPRYFDELRVAGFPDRCCDTTIIGAALCINGELPPPSFIIGHGGCEIGMEEFNSLAHWFHVPIFYLDCTLAGDENGITYLADQFRELIAMAEHKVQGIKYDEEKLIEMHEIERLAQVYYKDIYELRKRSPCPLAGRDAFRNPRRMAEYPDQRKALEYIRIWHDELMERAENGIGAVAEEKLRFLWVTSGPIYANPFAYLEKRGVTVPIMFIGGIGPFYGSSSGHIGDDTEYGRKLSPLEEEARRMNRATWVGLSSRWVNGALQTCRDLRIDGIVNFRQMGCTQTLGIGKLLEERAERELGIPTLQIDGRNISTEMYDEAEFNGRLDAFVDMCMASKGVSG